MQLRTVAALSFTTLVAASPLSAQHTHGGHAAPPADSARMVGAADAAMGGDLSEAARKHLELTPARAATAADSAKALEVAATLRKALTKYADTAAATADGYRLFLPGLKTQKVFHFTNYRHAMLEAFRFDPEKPTSLLYQRGSDGTLQLIGAMYTAPKRVRAGRLDDRVPLSIARWHKHVNWCVPPKGEERRWLEQRDGLPLFGPESPVATRRDCDGVGGKFHESVFGWMIHANVFLGSDLATVYGHDH
jgi:hypothetical protein